MNKEKKKMESEKTSRLDIRTLIVFLTFVISILGIGIAMGNIDKQVKQNTADIKLLREQQQAFTREQIQNLMNYINLQNNGLKETLDARFNAVDKRLERIEKRQDDR